MSQGDVAAICKDAVMTALMIAAPFLVVSLVIGLLISVLQAATQIHEQTVTFIFKIVLIGLMLLVLSSWMIAKLLNFTQSVFGCVAGLL